MNEKRAEHRLLPGAALGCIRTVFSLGMNEDLPIRAPEWVRTSARPERWSAETMDAEHAESDARNGAGRPPSDPEACALFERGLAHLDSNETDEAESCLREAARLAPEHAQIRSYLGLAIARVGGDFSEARSLCEEAAKQEFFNPVLYLNLAKVFLRFGRRSEALRYLRRGQMIDPGHTEIRASIASLGSRRLPIVPFLPRRHPLNRALGTARNRMMSAFVRA